MSATHSYAGIPANSYIKTVDNTVIDSFESARSFLANAHGGSVQERQIASNTLVSIHNFDADMREPEAIDIILYKTPVVRYYNDGTFSVDNGGYNTRTTAMRITQFTPEGFSFCHQDKKLTGGGVHGCTHEHRFSVPHKGHYSRIGGTYWCDTCNSPYCELA